MERVSVNSLGIGGSNARVCKCPRRSPGKLTSQVILESVGFYGLDKPRISLANAIPRLSLLLLSPKNDVSLQASVEKHARYLEKHGSACLRDLAYTLATRRDHHEQRAFAICDGEEPLIAQPSARVKSTEKTLIFAFTGQGAQWAEMGKQLIDDFPSVRGDIAEMDRILSQCHTPPSWKIEGMMWVC